MVIALAAMAFMAVRDIAIPPHPKRSNLNAVRSLEGAVNNYMAEYGRLPASTPRFETDGKAGKELLSALLGLEEKAGQMKNPRAIKFLSVKEGRDRKDGLIYGEGYRSVEGLFDSWGRPFIVEMDVVNKGALRFDCGATVVELPGRMVAAYSVGADGKAGTEDDIRSWEK